MAMETSLDKPAPVRAIAMSIGSWIDRLGAVWVEGQLAQINRRPGTSIVFMTLRDTLAEVSISLTCPKVLFDSLNPPLIEGASVVVHAKPRWYANRGTLSLEARDIRAVGLGELLAQLERRRQLLAAEGLFAAELKRPLPFLPHRIGLVTGSGSAAERDVLDNARRRWPGVEFEIVYAAMQGPRSALEVAEAVGRLDRNDQIDVIVIARGGGSVEDLLPFSDEGLIRAVHAARTPVVSAIGHEPDTPLLDYVADLRASTPTDAAKRIVPDVAEQFALISTGLTRMRSAMRGWLDRETVAVAGVRARLGEPRTLITERATEIDQLRDRSRRSVGHRLDRAHDEIAHLRARAQSLSPLATLQRGYAVLQDADGHVIDTVTAADSGAEVSVRVADGRIGATVTSIEPDPHQQEDDHG
ncbi:MAG: exodeoxyribonuclease VII large subunit [Nocardioides sp.]